MRRTESITKKLKSIRLVIRLKYFWKKEIYRKVVIRNIVMESMRLLLKITDIMLWNLWTLTCRDILITSHYQRTNLKELLCILGKHTNLRRLNLMKQTRWDTSLLKTKSPILICLMVLLVALLIILMMLKLILNIGYWVKVRPMMFNANS